MIKFFWRVYWGPKFQYRHYCCGICMKIKFESFFCRFFINFFGVFDFSSALWQSVMGASSSASSLLLYGQYHLTSIQIFATFEKCCPTSHHKNVCAKSFVWKVPLMWNEYQTKYKLFSLLAHDHPYDNSQCQLKDVGFGICWVGNFCIFI